MIEVKFGSGELTASQQEIVSSGFASHTDEKSAPPYARERLHWLAYSGESLVGALTADALWDWLYVDELWIDPSLRGQGLGKKLLQQAESCAREREMTGVWLWTQSWQAADFYARLGYQEFTRFADFPKGHSRIGLRKTF